MCTASMQAQTVVAQLGFEDGEEVGKFKTEYSLSPELGTYGDWVNYKETDEWSEKCKDDPHSGEYCFMAANTGEVGQTWDRGFKLSFPMKLETPYRVSFWAKIDPSYSGADGTGNRTIESTELTSWLSKGMEMYDKSILSYGMDHMDGPSAGVKFNGEWQHVSYVVYNPTAEAMDATIPSWQGTGVYPERFGGDGTQTYREFYDAKFPEIYFFIANMFCPVTYYLDDIVIEEGVTVREVTYSTEIIKIDFGYATNIASLAKDNKGTVVFDKSLVKVTVDGEEVDVVYVEGKEDGFLYVNVGTALDEDADVVVSFEGAEDLLYSSTARPSSDTTGKVQVFGFKNEKAYWDETVDTEFLAWGQPTVKTSVPMDKSFNLKPEDVKEVSMTFTSAVSTKNAKATLIKGAKKTDLTAGMKLSEDGKTITMPVSIQDNGAYEVVISGLKNADGTVAAEDASITFEVGEVSGDANFEVIYQSDYSIAGSNVPYGFSGYADGAWQLSTREAPYSGSGSAPRLMSSGESKGIYMCARPNGNKVSLEFGKYAAVAAAENGGEIKNIYDADNNPTGIDPSTEALYLEPGNYILDFVMPAWDTSRTAKTFKSGIYSVTIDNAQDDPYQDVPVEEWDEPAPRSVIGTSGAFDTSVLTSEDETTHEFTIAEPGYYYVKFSGTDLGYEAWLLVSLSVSSKPESEGAFYIKQLNDAIAAAEQNVNGADEKYNGTAKDALAETIKKAKEGSFTNPDAVTAMVKELSAATQKFTDRKTNYDSFVKNYEDAKNSLETLEGKYKTNPQVKDAEAIIKKYDGVNPTSYSDDELAAASKDVDGVPGILNNIKSVVDILTYRAAQASEFGLKLDVADEVIDHLDELAFDATADIDAANKHITLKFYQAIAAGDDLESMKDKQYSSAVDEEFDETDPESVATHDADGHKLILSGIPVSGYVRNPNFYTTATDASVANFPGWTLEPYTYETTNDEGETVENTGSAKMTAAATADNPAVTASLNGYGQGAEYKFYQVIENVPAGEYMVNIQTRTASKNNADADGNYGYFNAQNDETGIWDKYIFAQVDDETPIMVPFTVGAYNTNGYATYISGIKIKDGQKLTIGAVEHYTSGKASGHDWDDELGAYVPKDFWDTNTWVRNATLYFTNPLEGYDYAAAAKKLADDIETAIEAVEATPAAQSDAIYNLAGQQVDENYKGIVIKNGVKFLQK